MSLFGKKSSQTNSKTVVPPELQSYYFKRNTKKAWVKLLTAIIVIIILIVGGIWLGLWLHNRASSNSSYQTSNHSNQVVQPKPSAQSSSNGSNSLPAGSQKSTVSGSSTAGTTQPTSTMPNTGPGNSLMLVVVSSVIVGTIYFRFRLIRKLR